MARTTELLLTETVENLGIVGDVVSVRHGYARNYLLPRGLAMPPSDEAIKDLAEKRAQAERERARQQELRASMIERLEGVEINLERSCNDQGLLYGSVTQRDIAEALGEQGFEVRPRDVRLAQTIKRIDTYDVLIKFSTELSATIKVWVMPDRELEAEDDEREEMEFDDEGNLIEKPKPAAAEKTESEAPQESAEPVN